MSLELCQQKAHKALRLLLSGAVHRAEACLRSALVLPHPPEDLAIACLLGDLGLCALHKGSAADASEAIRHSIALLPEPEHTPEQTVPLGSAWLPLAHAQLRLNLCESLTVEGHHLSTFNAAREAVRFAQLAIPHHGSTPRANVPDMLSSTAAIPRLFAARWLSPLAQQREIVGSLAAPEALMIAWLWCAIAQERLGSYQEAMRCYSRAMGVAHVDRRAAFALSEQLKKKIALGEVLTFGPEETTGLVGQQLEASDFRLTMPYVTSVTDMLSTAGQAEYRPAPHAPQAAAVEPRVAHRSVPQLRGVRRAPCEGRASSSSLPSMCDATAGVHFMLLRLRSHTRPLLPPVCTLSID